MLAVFQPREEANPSGALMFVGTENTGDGDAVSCTSPRSVRPMTRWPTSPKR
jgi:hypothetical protein